MAFPFFSLDLLWFFFIFIFIQWFSSWYSLDGLKKFEALRKINIQLSAVSTRTSTQLYPFKEIRWSIKSNIIHSQKFPQNAFLLNFKKSHIDHVCKCMSITFIKTFPRFMHKCSSYILTLNFKHLIWCNRLPSYATKDAQYIHSYYWDAKIVKFLVFE